MHATNKPPLVLVTVPDKLPGDTGTITPLNNEVRACSPTSDSAAHGIEPLLNASQVAALLNVNRRRVYELSIPQVRISARSVRWRPSDLQRYIESAQWKKAG